MSVLFHYVSFPSTITINPGKEVFEIRPLILCYIDNHQSHLVLFVGLGPQEDWIRHRFACSGYIEESSGRGRSLIAMQQQEVSGDSMGSWEL